jgi:hypothetical protein
LIDSWLIGFKYLFLNISPTSFEFSVTQTPYYQTAILGRGCTPKNIIIHYAKQIKQGDYSTKESWLFAKDSQPRLRSPHHQSRIAICENSYQVSRREYLAEVNTVGLSMGDGGGW